MAYRAPIRTFTKLYGSAMSAWVRIRAPSELMGPRSAGFALALDILPRIRYLRSNRRALDVLVPFHSISTTDSVESINGGLAESPSEVLNPPSSSFKAARSRV